MFGILTCAVHSDTTTTNLSSIALYYGGTYMVLTVNCMPGFIASTHFLPLAQATHILLHLFKNIDPSSGVQVFAYALNSHQDEWTHKVIKNHHLWEAVTYSTILSST